MDEYDASGRKNIAIKNCLIEVLFSREGLGLFQGLKEPAYGTGLCFSVCSQARGPASAHSHSTNYWNPALSCLAVRQLCSFIVAIMTQRLSLFFFFVLEI